MASCPHTKTMGLKSLLSAAASFAIFLSAAAVSSALAQEGYEDYGTDSGYESYETYDSGTYEEPVYEEPIYEEPAYTEPVYEEPVYQEEPYYEEPAYTEPAYEEPVYEEEPTYEEPAYTEPAYEEPGSATPEQAEELRDAVADTPAQETAAPAETGEVPLEAFDWPEDQAVAPDESVVIDRGGEASAAGQLSGLGQSGVGETPGTSIQAPGMSTPEAAAKAAGAGFDDAGSLGTIGPGDASVVNAEGIPPAPTIETLPSDYKTQDIMALIVERDKLEQKIQELDEKLAETPRETPEQQMAVFKLKDELTKAEQQKAYVGFSLKDKIDQRKNELAAGGTGAAGTTDSAGAPAPTAPSGNAQP